MNGVSRIAVLAVVACVWPAAAGGQQKIAKPPNPARLELTTEVAATTEDGYPSVLRVTIRNAGNVAVDMPMPALGCLVGGGGIEVRLGWTPSDSDGSTGTGWGSACGGTNRPSILQRIQSEGIRLRPGESIVLSENLHQQLGKVEPGTIEYWAEYTPPEASPEELAELEQAGYVVPTRRIESEHRTFALH